MSANQIAGIVFIAMGLIAIGFNRSISKSASIWTVKYYNKILPIITNERFERVYFLIIGMVFCVFGLLFVLGIIGRG